MPNLHDPLLVLDEWVAGGIVRGAGAAIWHAGDIVATHEAGQARDDQPVTPETLFALASVSKPLTASAVLHAVDAGDLTLDSPVSSIVPEFGGVDDMLADDVYPQLEALRDRVTVRHLLCHVSGLPENIGIKRLRLRDRPTLDHMIDVMCGLPLQAAPGDRLRYSNVGFGIAARVVERATGAGIHEYIDNRILAPLSLSNVLTRPGTDDADRITVTDDAASAGTDTESYNSRYWQDLGIPWGGYYGSPRDIARFAATFFPGETSVLSDDTKAEMIVDQTGGVPGGVDSAGVHWDRGAWGLGWEVAASKQRHWTGSRRSPATFCHWGQSGTLVWGDPERRLVLAVFGNRTVHKPWPLVPPRWANLSDAVIRAVDAG
jgi:CubicO group peptidase (beta-lactamase class C family)